MLTGEQLTRLLDAGCTTEQLKIFGHILDESVTKLCNEMVTKSNAFGNGEALPERYQTLHPRYHAEKQKRYRQNKKIKQIQEPSVTEALPKALHNGNGNGNASPYIDTFLLTSEEKKESKILTPMNVTALPPEWKNWAAGEFGWNDETIQDTWQLFFEYWTNGKGKRTKREKWGATWRTWCRQQATRIKSNNFNYGKPQEPRRNVGVL